MQAPSWQATPSQAPLHIPGTRRRDQNEMLSEPPNATRLRSSPKATETGQPLLSTRLALCNGDQRATLFFQSLGAEWGTLATDQWFSNLPEVPVASCQATPLPTDGQSNADQGKSMYASRGVRLFTSTQNRQASSRLSWLARWRTKRCSLSCQASKPRVPQHTFGWDLRGNHAR